MDKRMQEADPYNKAFVEIVLKHGKIHVLYAKQMGEKYLERYRRYFKNPIIHEHDLRHEELHEKNT